MMRASRTSQGGFTLIELALVTAIVGLLVAGGVSLGSSAMKAAERVSTTERLGAIQDAIDAYAKTNGYYPCPANRAQTPTGNPTTFGREIRPCAASAPGIVRVASNTVDIGMVPVRSLGLPDAYAADAWGNKFTYAVTVALESSVANADAAISINTGNRTGTNYAVTSATNRATIPSTSAQITPGEGAAYVVVSHGADKRGAYRLLGTTVAVTCGGGSQNDVENCDDANEVFWDTLFNDGNVTSSYFDDYVAWGSNALDRAPISTAVSTCTTGCEAWCAQCAGPTPNLPVGAPASMTAGTAVLCKKIITNPATCEATCIWAGTITTGSREVRCP